MLTWLILIGTLLIGAYIFFLWWSVSAWKTNKSVSLKRDNQLSVSIVIAARNEAQNMLTCLKSVFIACQKYDQLGIKSDIILVDDHSSDDTILVAQSLGIKNLKIVNASQFGKKSAITEGVINSTADVIIFTDADTKVGSDWINSHIALHSDYDFVTGVITFDETNNYLSRLQVDDMIATILLTNAGINNKLFYMANGANMSCKKSLWIEMQSMRNDKDISSGDDVFLIQSIAKKYPDKVGFLANRAGHVTTQSMSTWSELVTQRRRWASKTKQSDNPILTFIQALVFAMVLFTWLTFLAGLTLLNFNLLIVGITLLLAKIVVDYIYLKKGRTFLNYDLHSRHFLKASLAYQYYILVIGISAIFPSKYKWKDRVVSR
jgi:biofilm PGA synthesis N-glycosyltransferase PgaC